MAKKTIHEPSENNELVPTLMPATTSTLCSRTCKTFIKLAALALIGIGLGLSIYNLIIVKNLQQNQQAAYTQQTAEFKLQLAQQHTLLRQQQAALSQTQQQLTAITTNQTDNNWQLQEISYLVRLADLNLKYLHDPVPVLALLETADLQLRQMNNPQFDKLRQQLARDINSIRILQAIDIAGILAKLQALSDEVNKLPSLSNSMPPASLAEPQSTTVTTSQQRWQTAWQQVKQTLQNLVIIRHYDQAAQPVLSQEQKQLITLLIQMRLAQAGEAVLQRNQNLLQQNLQTAMQLVQINFGATPQKAALLSDLAALQQIQLLPTNPDLSNTLAAISQTLHTSAQSSTPQLGQQSALPKPKQPNTLSQESSLV